MSPEAFAGVPTGTGGSQLSETKLSRCLGGIKGQPDIHSTKSLSEKEADPRDGAAAAQSHVALGGDHRAGPGAEGGLGKGPWKEAELRAGLQKPREGEGRARDILAQRPSSRCRRVTHHLLAGLFGRHTVLQKSL